MAKAKASRQRRKSSPDANEMLVLELQQIHGAESQLSQTLPRLSKGSRIGRRDALVGCTPAGTARALAQALWGKSTVQAMQRALREGGPFDE